MRKINFAIVVALSGVVIGCATVADIKNATPKFQGEFQGNYSQVARCVADSMQRDKRWTINSLQYNVRVYPDIKTSEIQSYASGAYTGAIYAFVMTAKQVSDNTLKVIIKGNKYEGGVAWEALTRCAIKR